MPYMESVPEPPRHEILVDDRPVTLEDRPPQLNKANCSCQCGCKCDLTGEKDDRGQESVIEHEDYQPSSVCPFRDEIAATVGCPGSVFCLQRRHSSPEDGAVQSTDEAHSDMSFISRPSVPQSKTTIRNARLGLVLLQRQADMHAREARAPSPSSVANEPSTSGHNSVESSMMLAPRSVTPEYYLLGLTNEEAIEAGRVEITLPTRTTPRSFFVRAPLILAPQPQTSLFSRAWSFREKRREENTYPYPLYIAREDIET